VDVQNNLSLLIMSNNMMGISNQIFHQSLKGMQLNQNETPQEIKSLKTNIMNVALIPILSQNFNFVRDNRFQLTSQKNKIKKLQKKYPQQDLLFFENIIRLAESTIDNYEELLNLESAFYGTKKEVGTMIHRTKMIKLKPEYELYNMILGKPKNGYDNDLLLLISNLMEVSQINYEKIKEKVLSYQKTKTS
jgi:hypothetical protein